MHAADLLIGRLYRASAAVPLAAYREWALREVGRLIPFDAAHWGTGVAPEWRLHTSTLIGLPASFRQRLEATREVNPLAPMLLKRIDRPVDMREALPDAQFFDSPIYHRLFEPYGIRRVLATAHVDARSGVYSLLTLYRRDRDRTFTALERSIQRRVAFHLFNGASHVYFLHLRRRLGDVPTQAAAAVVDSRGTLHEVQARFWDLLDQHFPDRDPDRLPFPLPEPGHSLLAAGLSVHATCMGELTCLTVWPAGPLDRLSQREREVVATVVRGLSFKQAARLLGVAPSTVANHLYRVYRKLGINSRTELAQMAVPDGLPTALRDVLPDA